MVNAFDRIVVAVPDLAEAVAQYRQLLGAEPWLCSSTQGGPAAWLGLENTVLELVQRDVERSFVDGIVFRSDSAGSALQLVPNPLQLDIALCDGSASGEFRQRQSRAQSDRLRVDHLVLRTTDAGACIDLFAEKLGLRLALDQTVPEWGGRMLFFRAGKLTLEVIEAQRDKPTRDRFWGIAYQCPDIAVTVDQLEREGVLISGIREGRKPGTRVATVKTACLGIPTLLIEPAT